MSEEEYPKTKKILLQDKHKKIIKLAVGIFIVMNISFLIGSSIIADMDNISFGQAVREGYVRVFTSWVFWVSVGIGSLMFYTAIYVLPRNIKSLIEFIKRSR